MYVIQARPKGGGCNVCSRNPLLEARIFSSFFLLLVSQGEAQAALGSGELLFFLLAICTPFPKCFVYVCIHKPFICISIHFQEAFRAFHNDHQMVRKYMKAIHIGELKKGEDQHADIMKDMEELRQTAQKMVCSGGLHSNRLKTIV